MSDKKPTDAEIVKTLNEADGMEHIAIFCDDGKSENMKSIQMVDIIDLINRLQAEVENYKQIAENQQKITMDRGFEIKNLKAYIQNNGSGWGLVSHLEFCKNLKTEAYKECIEKAKSEIDRQSHSRSLEASGERFRIHKLLDNLLKELVGE